MYTRHRGQRVLVCAPSNIAVDNILEKIIEQIQLISNNDTHNNTDKKGKKNKKISSQNKSKDSNKGVVGSIELPRVLRLGHPARLSDSILQYCLDSQIVQDEVCRYTLLIYTVVLVVCVICCSSITTNGIHTDCTCCICIYPAKIRISNSMSLP